jgi:hypothetical protein
MRDAGNENEAPSRFVPDNHLLMFAVLTKAHPVSTGVGEGDGVSPSIDTGGLCIIFSIGNLINSFRTKRGLYVQIDSMAWRNESYEKRDGKSLRQVS